MGAGGELIVTDRPSQQLKIRISEIQKEKGATLSMGTVNCYLALGNRYDFIRLNARDSSKQIDNNNSDFNHFYYINYISANSVHYYNSSSLADEQVGKGQGTMLPPAPGPPLTGLVLMLCGALVLELMGGAAAKPTMTSGRRVYYRAGTHTVIVTKDFSTLRTAVQEVSSSSKRLQGKKTTTTTVNSLNMRTFGRIANMADGMLEEMALFGITKNETVRAAKESRRKKRSIEVIGDMWKALSGSPNKQDLDNIEVALEALQEADVAEGEELATIIHEQQHQNEFNNKTIRVLAETEHHLAELDESLEGQREALTVVGSVLLTASSKEALLDDVRRALVEVEMITDPTRTGMVSKKLLKPKKLEKTLSQLHEREGRVPIWTSSEADGYYREKMGSTKIMDGLVVAALNIPLVDKLNRYFLHETPIGKILLEDKGKGYRYLAEKDMNKCRELYTGEILCDLRRVVIHDVADVCTDAYDCVTGKTLPYSYVKELEDGVFSYRFPEESKGVVTCGRAKDNVNLNKTGIIVLEKGCTIATKNFYIDPEPDWEGEEGEADLIHWEPAFEDEEIDIRLSQIVDHHNNTIEEVKKMKQSMAGLESTMTIELEKREQHHQITKNNGEKVDAVAKESKSHWIGTATVLPILAVVVGVALVVLACKLCNVGKGIASVTTWMEEVQNRSKQERREERRRKRRDDMRRAIAIEMERNPPLNPMLTRGRHAMSMSRLSSAAVHGTPTSTSTATEAPLLVGLSPSAPPSAILTPTIASASTPPKGGAIGAAVPSAPMLKVEDVEVDTSSGTE